MEQIFLRTFYCCLISCATMAVSFIWIGEGVLPEWPFKLAATVFVVGLGCFLVWVTLIAYRILAVLK